MDGVFRSDRAIAGRVRVFGKERRVDHWPGFRRESGSDNKAFDTAGMSCVVFDLNPVELRAPGGEFRALPLPRSVPDANRSVITNSPWTAKAPL
jgi:hypothetical protein